MPDITMCKGSGYTRNNPSVKVDCPKKNNCWRFTATPTPERQSYFVGLPVDDPQDLFCCEYFWSNKE